MVAGPGGVSKSTYSLMLALGIATGRSDLACFEVKERAKVGIFNAEDDLTEVKRRLLACMIAHNVSWDDLRGPDGQSMLRVSSGVLKPLQLAYRTPGDTMRVSKATRQLADEVRAQELAALILDPFQEMHDAPENDNAAMKVATSAARDIAVNANVAVLLVAHTRKPSAASSEGFAGDIDSLRGASSQIGVIRVGATFFTASAKDEKTWHMPDGHRKYVRLDIAKNNLGPLTDEPKWFRRGSVKLGNFENADEIGILRPVTLERKVREAQTNVLQSVAQAIKDHLKPDTMYRLAEIIDHLPVEDQAVLRDKNRARSLNEAFGGPAVNDFVCEYGVLKRVTVGGNVGTTFSLSRVPHSASNTR
jgi:hypothetical protein